jgi:lipoprotein-anchoring transpeptidase ErfK/SrfK
VAVATATGCGGGGGDGVRAGGTAVVPTTSAPPTTAAAPALAPGTSLVAEARLPKVQVFPAADAPQPARTLANPTENGAPLVFLVEKQTPGWLQVDLPVRPNGSTGWVRATDVNVTPIIYRVSIQLRAFHITVWRGSDVILSEPVGLGTGSTPTPGGKYYIKELLKPPNPNGAYGPYAYGLSGFSNVLTSFAGGDGVVGIHGTNDPSGIGRSVSHGCIRMSNSGITKLAKILPLGTPVEIVS